MKDKNTKFVICFFQSLNVVGYNYKKCSFWNYKINWIFTWWFWTHSLCFLYPSEIQDDSHWWRYQGCLTMELLWKYGKSYLQLLNCLSPCHVLYQGSAMKKNQKWQPLWYYKVNWIFQGGIIYKWFSLKFVFFFAMKNAKDDSHCWTLDFIEKMFKNCSWKSLELFRPKQYSNYCWIFKIRPYWKR